MVSGDNQVAVFIGGQAEDKRTNSLTQQTTAACNSFDACVCYLYAYSFFR
jgi:hypothetical protein